MRAPPALSEFVRDALAGGAGRDEIAAALVAAGWARHEVDAGLSEWADGPGLPPVPRRRTVAAPRDALAHGLMFFALGVVVANLGAIGFALADVWMADPLEPAIGAERSVRWSIAAVVVAWPVWAWLTLSLARNAEIDPGLRATPVARWLTSAALLIAGMVIIGDLIGLLAAWLQSGLSARFALRAAMVGALAASVVTIYLPSLSAGDKT